MYAGQKNKRFVASFVLLGGVFLPVAAAFFSPSLRAAGGTIGNGVCATTVSNTSTVSVVEVGGRCVYTFNNGVNSFAPPTGAKKINFLVVGGGAGGGSNRGGGGGAGGFYESNWTYTSGSVDVVVGAGGAGGVAPTSNIGVAGTDGGTSSINGGGATFAAGGGGGGGAHGAGSANQGGRNGVAVPNGYTGPTGSGGGASMNYIDVGYAGGSATAGSGYANAGAASRSDLEPNRNTGGGGGAGSAGVSGSGGACDASTGVTPSGGTGRSSSLSGSSVAYAAGGGGADSRGTTETCSGPDVSRLTSGAGVGGSGIGGNGAALGGTASSAATNTGSGGGGGNSDPGVAGDGGSGVVILSVDVSKPISSGTTTTDYLPKATNSVTVAYTATDTAALSSVAVFYSVASDLSSPTQCGSATGLLGTSATGNITCTLPSSPSTTKTYYLYTVATDSSGLVEDVPGSSDDSFVHDAVTPLSTPTIVATATKSNIVSVDYTATDAVGLASVKAYVSLNSNYLGASLCGTATVSGTSASGSVNCTIPSAANGTTYYIYTVATDASGQTEATADQTPGDSILYDTAKPTFSNGPGANYFLKSASSFTIQSDDTGFIYFVSSSATVTTESSITSLNDDQFNAVSSAGAYTNTTVSAAGLPEGTYKIYAVDSAENVSDPYAWNVTVDDTSPTKPTSLLVPGYGDTGLSSSDGIGNDTTPILSVATNETNGTVLFSATKSGTTTTCSGSVYANGSVGESTCTFTTLAAGTWVVTAVHTDAAGNVSPVSDNFTMVIDTTVPTVPTGVDLVTDWDLGTSSTDNITSASYPRFSTTFPETTGRADLKVVQSSITGYTCSYTNTDTDQYCALEPTNVNATGLVYSMFTDVAGNSSAWRSTGLSVTFDRTAPTLTHSALNPKYGGPQSVSGSSNEAGAIYVAPVNVYSWSDLMGVPASSRKFTLQANANSSTAVPLSGLADYGYYVLYAVDTAGNISASSSSSFEVDATGPKVNFVFGTDGRYKAGSIVDINVRFNEVVTVVGTPRLALQGSIGTLLNYFSGSGTDTLTFRWTVTSNVNSSDLSLSGAGALDTGATTTATIKDAYGNAANFQTPSTGSGNTLQEQSNIIIDTTAPTFSWSAPSSTITNGTPVTYALTASEEVNSPVPGNFTNAGTATGCSYSITSANNIAFTVSVSGCADGTASPKLTALSVTDLAGNTGPSAATSPVVTTFDTVAPTITACACAKASGAAGTGTSVTVNSTGTVYLVKSTVTVTDIASITSASGDQWNSQSVTASTATTVFATGLVEGTYKLYAVDLAGNLSAVYAGGTLTVDNVAPTFSVVNGTYGNNGVVSTTSSEAGYVWFILQGTTLPSPVTADYLLNSGTLNNKRLVAVIASANTATNSQTFTNTGGQTTGIYDAYAVDAAGNVSPVLTSSFTLDLTRPTFVSVAASSPNGTYLYGQTINIDATFSEPMKANSSVVMILETGATDRSVPYASGTGTNVLRFTYTVQAGDISSDLDLVTGGGIYANGNLFDMYMNTATLSSANFTLPIGPSTTGSISNASDIVVDGVVPVVSSAVNTASGNQSSYSTTFTFSGDVTDFDVSDLTMGGTATGCTPSLTPTSASVYVVTYTGCSDGTITSTIRVDAVTFASTNRGPKTAYTTGAITRDTTAPTIIQSPVVTYFNATSTIGYTANGISTVYLVNTANTVTDAASITGLPSNQWKSFSYLTGAQSFNGTSLQDGLYKIYAVDTYGNMSTGTASSFLLDTVAPTVTLTSGTVRIGGSATLRSNDKGTLYLVKSTVSVTTIASITGSGSTNYKSQAIASADTDQNIAVAGLSDGTYYAYTSDGGMNLSPVSTTSIIVDNTAPTVTNVTAGSANGNYKIGDEVLIDVLFNDIVNVSTTGGTPTLLLETGTTDRNATYVSGTGTTTLRFSYTVQEGDLSTDLSYQSTTALVLNGGTIADVNGNNATLTLPAVAGSNSLAWRSAINVKGTRIAVNSATVPTTPTTLATWTHTFAFSEAVYGVATTDFTFGGTATGCSVSSVGTPTTSVTVTVIGCSDGTVILKLPAHSVQDSVGNTGPASDYSVSTITVDRTGPVPTFVLPSTPTNAASIVFTVNYNESMSGLAIADFTRSGTATGCSAGTVSAATGTSVTVTFTGCGEGTVMLRQNTSTVMDAMSNSGPATAVTSATVTIDRSKSTVSSFIPSRAMTNSSSSTFVLTLNEEVTGLASGDITYTGTATGCSFSPDTTSGTVISITVTGCSTGTVIPRLVANGVTDLAGNTGPAADYIGSTLTIDRTAPSASAAPSVVSGSDTGISSTDGKTNLTTLNVSATTPETTGTLTFTATSGSTTVTCTAPVSSSSGSCSLSGLSEGTWTISTVFTDAAGNDSVVSATSTFTIDTTTPTVSIAVPTSPVRILPETFTLTFSELINGLTSSDISNGGGTSSGCTFTPSASSGTVITVSVNNCGDGTLALQINANGVNDESGNTGPTVAEVAAAVTIDNGPPTVMLTNARVKNSGNAIVRSTKPGDVYLVKSTVAVSALTDITNAAGNIWNSVAVTNVDTDTALALMGLTDGTYYAYATDVQNRLSVASSASFTVDNTAPVAPVSIALAAASDRGISSSDGITNVSTPTIKVVASEAGGTVTVTASKSGETEVTCSMNASTTGSTCDLGTLVDGTWTLSATQSDVATNTSISTTASVSIDTASLSISGVSSNTVNGAKKNGASIDVRVTFDKTVYVDSTGGSPTLLMETGATDRTATFTSGSNSSVLVFTYAVQAGDASGDLDYNSATALTLNSSVITDVAGNTSTPILPTPGAVGSLGANKSIVIDTTAPNAPTLPSATIAASANASIQADEVISAYLVSTSITVTSLSDITIANGALWNQVSIASINTATSFPATGLGDGVYRAYVVDSAGNISSASSGSITVDSTAPTVAITFSSSSVASGGTSTITFTLSETVTGFAVSDVNVGLGTLSNFSGSGLQFTATFTASSAAGGSAVITVDAAAFTDAAGNPNAQTTSSITVASPAGTNGRESASNAGSNYIIEQFTTAGIYHWTVPSNVTSVEYIVIGGGGGGGGGGYVSSGNGGGGGGGGAGSLRMGTVSVIPGSDQIMAVGRGGAGGAGGQPSMSNQFHGIGGIGGEASNALAVQSNGGYGGCPSGLNASVNSCGYLLITDGYGGFGGSNADATGGARASILGGGGGGGAGSYGNGGSTSTSTGGLGGVGTAANFYGISDTFGTGGNGGPGAVGALNGTNGARRGNGGNGGGGGLNGSNAGSGGTGSDGFIAIRYAVPAVSTPDMEILSDTGASSTDNLTRLTTPMFTGTAAMGATVQLYVDSISSGSPCTADIVTGVYNCTTGTLTNGSHTVSATSSIVLAGGETTSTSSTLSFEVDSTPPVPTLTTATLQWGENATAKSNKLGTLYLVKDSITVTSLTDITLAANNVWNSASVSAVNTDTTMSTSGLISGDYKIYAVDIAGNIGTNNVNRVTYVDDTTAPTATLTNGRLRAANSALMSSNELGTIYLVKSSVVVNTLSDITSTAATIRTSASVVSANGTINLSVAGLSEGTYHAYAVDPAGNLSTASTGEIVIDNTLPTMTTFSASATAYIVRTFDLTLTFSESITGLSSSDFSNSGTASSCTFTPDNSSGTTFIISVSCSSDGTVVTRLASNAVNDLAGNAGPSTVSNASSVTLGANPTKLVLTTSSVGTASGAAFTTQPAITLKNAQDLVVPSFSATVTASITTVNGTGVLVGTTTAAVDTATGIATFSDLGISGRAGTQYTITYTSGSLTVATQNITVTVGAAVGLDVSTQPVGGASGALFATQPIVRVIDSGSNTVTTASVSVSVGASTGTLGGTRPRVTASGVATFTDLTFSGLASQSHALSFTSTGLLSVVSSSFNVTVGTATQVVLTTQSVGTESGVAFTTQPVLEIRDSGGNKVSTSSASVTASVGTGASLDGTKIVSASSGVVTYSNIGISGTAGTSYTITYSSPGLSPAVQAVTPTVGPATKLQIDTQPVGAGAGAALATQPVIHVVDSGSNIIVGSNATIVAVPSAGILGGTTTMTATSGEAAFSNLTFAGTAGTNYQITFTSVGLSPATSSNFTVSVGVATHLAITTQPVGATAGAALATQPVVKVLDAGDNVVAGSSASVVASSSAGTLGGTVTINAVNGVATYSNLTFAGTINTDYTLSFASASIASAQSNNIRVTVGAAHRLALTTSAANSYYAQAFGVQPVVEVQDAGGNRTASTAVVTATLDNGTVLSGSGASKTATAVSGVATFDGLGIIGAPGTYNITYSATSLQNATQTINVNKSNQTITFTAPTDRVYSTVAFTLSGSSTSSLTVTYASTTTSICTVSNGSVTMVGIGTCSITASQVGNGNYNAASDVVRTFVISRATPVVTFNTLFGKTYGDATFNVSATADVPVQLSFSSTSGVCSVGTPTLSTNTSTVAVTIVSAGTCTISVSRAQDATYEAAIVANGSSLTRSFEIAKATGTISFTQNTLNQTYNGSARIVTATSNTGTLTITYTGIAPTVYAPSTTPPVNAGSYAVVAVMNDTNYALTAAETLIVAKAQGAIALDANTLVQLYSGTSRSAVVGSTTPALLAVTVTYAGTQGTVYGPSLFAPTDAGSYAVTASLNDTNYQATTTGTLVVGLGVQSTVSFISRSTTDFDDPFTLLAVGGTGTGTMSYAAVSGPCTVETSSGLLTPTGTGACVVTATRGSSGNFGATSSAAFTVTINQASQMVEFTSTVPSRPLPGNTYTPTAVSSSGLVPTFSISQGSGTVCTISSGVVTIVASGTCEVTADQVGNSDWLAADPVTQSMVAGRLNQSITFTAVTTKSFGDPVFSLGATASSGRAVDYSVVTGATTCSVAAGGVVTLGVIGTCVVEASQPGDNVYLPAVSIRRSITVIPTVPSAPFLSSVSTNDGSVTVAYSAPSSDGGLPVQAYSIVVRYAGADRNLDVTRTDCPLTMSCYIDGLTNGRNYSVTVTAKNAVGAGAASAASPLILPVLNPQAVRGLTARAGNQVIDAAWTAPSNLGGGTFARYEISIRDRSGVYQAPISLTDQNSTSYQFTGLDNGTGYDIKVVTITSAGTTEFTSNTAEVFEMPRTVPSAPRDVTIAAPTGRIARVSWRIPQTDGGAVITSYVTNVPGSLCVMTTPVDVVCEISGLTPGSPLSVEVRAVNSVGSSQPMNAAINLPTRPTPPSIRSVIVNASTAQAVWAPPVSDGGQPILGYLVFVTESGARVSSSALNLNDAQCVTAATTCQIEGLDPTKKYVFTVRAVNAVGESESSAPLDPFAKEVVAVDPSPATPAIAMPTINTPQKQKVKPKKQKVTKPSTSGSTAQETVNTDDEDEVALTTSVPPSTVPQNSSETGNNSGADRGPAGIVASVLFGVIFVAICWFVVLFARRRRRDEEL